MSTPALNGGEGSRASAERTAMEQRLQRLMSHVVIYGSGEAARRVWEAIARCGTAEVIAFVDSDPRRQGRTFLGTPVHAPSWLSNDAWDVVAVASADQACIDQVGAAVGAHRVAVFPIHADDDGLARAAARLFPDPLAALLAGRASRAMAAVGIFGTGAAGMKVWEALADIDEAEAVWFADNNPARHGQRFLWLPVIAPAEIPWGTVQAIVVGSMSREPICRQLLALGIPRGHILTPDVTACVDVLRTELKTALQSEVRPPSTSLRPGEPDTTPAFEPEPTVQ